MNKENDRVHLKIKNLKYRVCFFVLLTLTLSICNADPGYRTPGGRRALSYEPMTWN